ncbi:hypothetical protein Ddye_022351 [Dipteronia dyeriana]|uniref:PGG domain-containing protein n=1 Tax=Dipteronia dyeriana TaxID=168575 RepID=A0AAD9U3E8_9ROSI|nr:hypothetical protein Ddye_022351 [Dipteronia dyeriana]
MERIKESHLIVAGLIATVTFTAAFTLPGGAIQEGSDEGTAILSKKAAFGAFVITDAIAMVLSLSAVFAHFLMTSGTSIETSACLLAYGASLTMIVMGAMVIAFVTGIYPVLTNSLWLAILTTFICLSFFMFMYLVSKKNENVNVHDVSEPQFDPIPDQVPNWSGDQFTHIQRLIPPPYASYSTNFGEVAPRPVDMCIAVEAMNNAIKACRELPITGVIDYIRGVLHRWFYDRRTSVVGKFIQLDTP